MVISKIRRGLRKPPQVILKRILQMCREQVDRYTCVSRFSKFDQDQLLNLTQTADLIELWSQLAARPFFCDIYLGNHHLFISEHPDEVKFIFDKAQLALKKQVQLLGSELVSLGETIDWLKDYKTGFAWPVQYFHDIDFRNPGRPSDVKFPWELSRMQWLIPAGQAYLLTGDEQYAVLVKDVIEQWIDANPYAYSVNWACTMEVALRIIVWCWFFRVFHGSRAWSDSQFQFRFLKILFLHAEFTEQHLELSDINGNHYTSDAAGLHCAGLFFGTGETALRWQEVSWKILTHELPRQVFNDGVDFEASVAYHRLVTELFFLPARYREKLDLPVPAAYRERLIKMAEYTCAYTRYDGGSPLWGDADDARVIPFGSQKINDHRYLSSLIGAQWQIKHLLNDVNSGAGEIYWWHGPQTLQKLQQNNFPLLKKQSIAFAEGGFYIMRNGDEDHVFIDCGPIGLGGRGGHGHNDCLSFEAMLNKTLLISDCGAYVYTASYDERNLFRSTAYHNTPQIDGEEINRFTSWDELWSFRKDAQHQVISWRITEDNTFFCGAHTGYLRLPFPVSMRRNLILDHQTHSLELIDEFFSDTSHHYKIPLHLAQNVVPQIEADKNVLLNASGQQFLLSWDNKEEWNLSLENCRISPSYGVVENSKKLLWRRMGKAAPFKLKITPLFPSLREG